jgi:hypothetical protein
MRGLTNMSNNWLTDVIAKENAYDEGYEAGKQVVLDEIDDILDRCAHDNGEMIVRALKELKEKYRR